MIIINIAHAVKPQTVETIRLHLDGVQLHNPDWNGAIFHIERSDFTEIVSEDHQGASGTALLRSIFHIIEMEQ